MDSPRPSPKNNVRLQKYLAACGVGSRRACEHLIDDGVVTVDGEVIDQQGVTIDPSRQIVRVEGRRVGAEPKVYLALNKPRDFLCTSSDPEGRKTVHDLLPRGLERVYTIGRLDRDSEGLILLTNDGELAQALMHPRHHVSKVYHVLVNQALTAEQERQMLRGVVHDGERLRAIECVGLGETARGVRYRIVLGEGRKRQIRRMFDVFDLRVIRLQRIAVGSIQLGSLKTAAYRPLRPAEVERLQREGGMG